MMKLVFVLVAVVGCADATNTTTSGSYLALGDSVAFGFDPRVDLKTQTVSGYPELLGAKRELDVVNLACPGEASGGFVSPTGHDNHCRENRQMYPLHVAYDGTQLAAAVDFLGAHQPELVTIDLGANDVFLLDHICNRDLNCILTNFVGTMTEYDRNLAFIFSELRRVYDGPIVALAIYNPYPADSTAQYAIEKINGALAAKTRMFGGTFADGMAAFGSADPCKAGLLIPMPDGTCDVHPTTAGAEALANAIDAALPTD